MSHWLCVAICRPNDQHSVLYPDVVAVGPDRSQIQLEGEDGVDLRHFGPVTCHTMRLAEKGWVNTEHFKSNEFDCMVTDSRLIISQPRYYKARSGPVIAPIWLLPLVSNVEMSTDQSVLAGHVRYPWVVTIAARGPKYVTPTLIDDWGVLRLIVERPEVYGGTRFCLEIRLNHSVSHEAVAQDLARRVATYRLRGPDELSDENRAAWERLPSTPSSRDATWVMYTSPTYRGVGSMPRRANEKTE